MFENNSRISYQMNAMTTLLTILSGLLYNFYIRIINLYVNL